MILLARLIDAGSAAVSHRLLHALTFSDWLQDSSSKAGLGNKLLDATVAAASKYVDRLEALHGESSWIAPRSQAGIGE